MRINITITQDDTWRERVTKWTEKLKLFLQNRAARDILQDRFDATETDLVKLAKLAVDQSKRDEQWVNALRGAPVPEVMKELARANQKNTELVRKNEQQHRKLKEANITDDYYWRV